MAWYCLICDDIIVKADSDHLIRYEGPEINNPVMTSIFLMDADKSTVDKVFQAVSSYLEKLPHRVEIDNEDYGFCHSQRLVSGNIIFFFEESEREVSLNKRPLIPRATARIDVVMDNRFLEVDEIFTPEYNSIKYRVVAQSPQLKTFYTDITEVDMHDPTVREKYGFQKEVDKFAENGNAYPEDGILTVDWDGDSLAHYDF